MSSPESYSESESEPGRYSDGAVASAALTVIYGLIRQLIAKGLLTKQEALGLYAKSARELNECSDMYRSDIDATAAKMLAGAADKLRGETGAAENSN